MHVGVTAITRRTLLKGAGYSALVGSALAFAPSHYARAFAPTRNGDSPYGPLRDLPDANGMLLPDGFSSRVVATSGRPVVGDTPFGIANTGYTWHGAPDGAACIPDDDPDNADGWLYVNNAELSGGAGGVGALKFAADGSVLDGYRILDGTTRNCAGGVTPWGTWLTCEEAGDDGYVWETYPSGDREGVRLPMLGACNHEAVCVDPVNEHLFLTEDAGGGKFYRYVPAPGRYAAAVRDRSLPAMFRGDGVLQAAVVDADGATTWVDVPNPSPEVTPDGATWQPLQQQVPQATSFSGAEGIWYDSGYVYFTTKGDDSVWVHDIAGQRITRLYDPADVDEARLTGVDNLTVAPSGDVLIAEDNGNPEIHVIAADTRIMGPLVYLPFHQGSEITGPCFSPDGTRLYFSSQRGSAINTGGGQGITYEITGPFRTERVAVAATGGAPANGMTDPAPHNPGGGGNATGT